MVKIFKKFIYNHTEKIWHLYSGNMVEAFLGFLECMGILRLDMIWKKMN